MPPVSNSLDSDQARQNVGPGLGPNYLQWLSADDASKQRLWTKAQRCVYMFTQLITVSG